MKENFLLSRRSLVVLVVPAIFLLLCLRLKFAVGPYYLGPNNDPAYLYLINSLYLLDGLVPGFIQHPGITLQMLGAAVIKTAHLNHDFPVVVESVFRNPEFYLNSIYYVVLAVNTVSLAVLGWYAASRSGSLALGVLTQTSAFLVVNWGMQEVIKGNIPVVANVNAENFLIGVVNVYGILILKLFFDEKKDPNKFHGRLAVVMGLLCATGFATKILFLPWAWIPLLLLPKHKDKWIFAGMFLLGVGLWAVPILKSLPWFLQWHTMAMTHTGTHGSGGQGLVDIGLYARGLLLFLKKDAFYFSSVAAWGVLAFISFAGFFKAHINTDARRYLAALCSAVLLALLIFARQPYLHYVVPTLNFFGLICFFGCCTLGYAGRGLFLGAVMAAGIAVNIFLSVHTGTELARINKEIYEFSQEVYHDHPDCLVCGYYRSSSPAFALQFGDDNQGHKAYTDVLRKVYPNTYFYHYWGHYFHDGSNIVYYEDMILQSPCVLLYGSRLDDQFNQGFIKVHEIASARSEGLYRVDAVTATQALVMYENAKHYESAGQYATALDYARKARFFGLRSMDKYMRELEDIMAGKH